MSDVRHTVARIDLGAIEANLRSISGFLRPSAIDHRPSTPGIIAVVKANAYGHGSADVGLALERAGAAMLACADIEEGIVLRRAGVQIPILVFGALGISDLDGVFEFDLTPTISTPTAAHNLAAATAKYIQSPAVSAASPQNDVASAFRRKDTRLHCHLKIDTGMNRLGFRHDNLARTLPEIAQSEYLAIDAVYTHFATADEPEHPAFAEQRERFEKVLV